jgi:hypothetical protein
VKQVTTVKKDKKYQVSVSAHPLDAKPEEIKSNLGEWVCFIITKEAGKDKLKVEHVILDHFGL